MSDQERETLSVKTASTRDQLAKADWENLMLDAKFLRVVLTIFELAGMFAADYHSDGRTHAWLAGRRSLGLDILRTAEKYLGPDALLTILEAEKKNPKEAPNDRSGYASKRTRELGGSDDERPVADERYLDYGPVAEG